MALTRYPPEGWSGQGPMIRTLREVNFVQEVVPCPPMGCLVHIFLSQLLDNLYRNALLPGWNKEKDVFDKSMTVPHCSISIWALDAQAGQ